MSTLRAVLNERAQVTFDVSAFAAVYPSLASASWRLQIRPEPGSATLYFDFTTSGVITYIASPLAVIVFQAPTSALVGIPAGAAAYEYGFVLPGADYERAGFGQITFFEGVVDAGVEGSPSAPTGSDDTWLGGANPTPNPVPPTLTSVIALVTQAVAAAQAAAAASGSGSAITAAASAASALASATTATSEAGLAAAQVALAQAQVALAAAQASAAATSATAAAGFATSAAAQVTLAAAQVALATAQASAAAASAAAAAASGASVSALFFQTATAVTAATIPSTGSGGPAAIKTLGYFTAGDYGSATYTRVASGGQLTSADGQSWQISDLEPYCNAFGAVGNNVADDTAAIQACLDFVMNNGRYKARLAPGTYKTSDTIHVGYGWGPTSGRFCTICLEGETGVNAGSFGSSNPTSILATFQDRPIINIQGVQRGGVSHLNITGPGTLAGVTSFGNYTGWSVLEFANSANYIPVKSGVNANSYQNTPFCGVCIDAYYTAGAGAPANPYPSPVYPSWINQSDLPAAAPYGVFQSTDCFVRDCTFNNCLIGIMNQPYGVGNGDFMKFTHNEYNGCLIGVCIGGSQARVTDYTESKFAGCYTCIDGSVTQYNGSVFGSGAGNVSGDMKNMHANYCYQLLATNGGWQKGINIDGFYSEVMTRIGLNDGSPCTISCNDCWFTCNNYASTTQVFMMPIYEGASCYVKFNRCKFVGLWGAAQVNAMCRFDGCEFLLSSGPGAGYSTTYALETTAYQRLGYVMANQFHADPTFNAFESCNSLNGANYSGYDTGGAVSNNWHSVGYSGFSPLKYLIPESYLCSVLLSVTAVTWTGRTFTAIVNVPYCQVGDVLLTAAGWCVLTSVSGTSISATMISHFQYSSGTFNVVTYDNFGNYTAQTDAYMNANYTSMGGYYHPINIFDQAPSINGQFWQTVAGSPVVTFGFLAGGNTFTPTAIPTGITTISKVLWTNSGESIEMGIPFPSGTTVISAVGTNTLTMSANALISGYWSATPGICRVA